MAFGLEFLFWSWILELPMVDVVDPGGLIRSQVIEDEDGALRLTLNGAENRKTLAGHFLAESFDSTIQHLAFSAADIFASAERMRALGFRPLEVSPNYYDDLEARLGLAPELMKRLRAGNILYDRDDAGEYLQFYSTNYVGASSSRSWNGAAATRAMAPSMPLSALRRRSVR